MLGKHFVSTSGHVYVCLKASDTWYGQRDKRYGPEDVVLCKRYYIDKLYTFGIPIGDEPNGCNPFWAVMNNLEDMQNYISSCPDLREIKEGSPYWREIKAATPAVVDEPAGPDICVLCKANPRRKCDCTAKLYAKKPEKKPDGPIIRPGWDHVCGGEKYINPDLGVVLAKTKTAYGILMSLLMDVFTFIH